MKRLATTAVLIGAGAFIFREMPDTIQPEIDDGILAGIAIVYTLGIVIALTYTRQWSIIGCGLIATMTGDALLYAWISDLPIPHDPIVLDIARSCFIVGSVYLLIGLALWARSQRQGENGDTVLLTDQAP